jgi:hypothetical protein
VLACAALVRQLALAAVELPPAAAAKAAGGAAGRLAALMCTSSAAWLLPRLKTLLTPLVAALAMHDQVGARGTWGHEAMSMGHHPGGMLHRLIGALLAATLQLMGCCPALAADIPQCS